MVLYWDELFSVRLCNYPPVISKVMQSVNCHRSRSRSPAAARLNTPWTSAIHFKLLLQIVIANNGVILGFVFGYCARPSELACMQLTLLVQRLTSVFNRGQIVQIHFRPCFQVEL